MPMCSGRSASAGSRWIHGLSPSTSNERATAQRAPFFHLMDSLMASPISRRAASGTRLCARDLHQHLGIDPDALAQILERDALVVTVDPLDLFVVDDERTEAVSVQPAAPEHPVVGEGDQDHRPTPPPRRAA